MTDAYTRQLAKQLIAHFELVTELSVPYTNPDGHWNDLIIQRRRDGHGDGWAVLDTNDHAWTGTRWLSTTVLARSDIYHYPDPHTAIDEALRLATDLSTASLIGRRLTDRESAP